MRIKKQIQEPASGVLAIGKNLRRIVLLFVVFLSLFGFSNATALEKNIVITDVAIKDKSETITVEEPALSNNDITSNITFNKTGDFATFELSLTNNESEKYKIESIEDNNTNDNIEIDYSFSEDYIDAGGLSTVTIKLTYKNTLINVDKISIDDLTIKIYLVNEDGEGGEIIINPATSDALPFYLVILAVALAGLVLLFKNKKNKVIKIGGILVALAILFIPLATLAKEKYEVQIKFTDIDIIGEFETYNITINPGNGDEILVVPVQYGNKLESLPANPSKDGYDFDKWVDDDGNTVTSDTVITGPITVEAQYTIKHYAISYDLDGGSLPDGKTNPSDYTIEDEITVNNPEKLGYTFTGWSGTGIDGKTTNLVIPAGSKDERSYVSNYSANEDTPYTVTHRYQNLDDLTTYTESTVTEYGETDKTIPAPRQERTGFETPAVQNVKVEADGSAHITYTYDRKQIHLHINNSRFIVEGDVTGYYPYGSTIHLTAIERPGYTFGWNDGVKTYARDYVIYSTTVLAPGYVANTDTPYVVNHYKQKLTLDGYEIADTQNLTGMTDAPISPAVNSYTGFKSPAVQHTTIAGDKSTVVNYYYDREMYEFSFNDNENITSTKPADSYPYETVITLTANTVDGKTFSKWSNNETDNPLTITLTGDLTIEPVYIDNSLTVTFDTGDGSEVASQTVNYSEKATRPTENPTKKNYLFYDWYTTDSYETVFNFNTEITADTTIYARFVPSSFPTVFEQEGECIFNGSEGVLEGENCAYANGENKYIDTGVQLYIAENHDKDYEIGFTIKSYDYLENERQATFMNTKLEGNSYPGLVFRKYDDEDQLDLSSRRTSSANSRKLWVNQAKERAVRIYRITNKATKIQEIFYSMDGGGKVRLNDLSQFNPVFDTSVWFGAAPTNTSANVAQRILVGTLSNMYIKLGSYEEPEGLTYTVDFDANGGSVSPASVTKDKGDAVGELPTPTNIPAGKEFDGWYTDLGEKGVKVDSSYMPNTGTTLYAKYTDAQKFTVTFNTDGGSSVASQTVTYGGKATRPSTDPTKEGYIFDDWYMTSGYATVFDFANTAITTDTTIYAKFDVKTCKTFATDSWPTIRNNLVSDSSYYPVGCEKEVELDMDDDSTPESYTVRLANTSTPEVCSTEGYSHTACGIVIEFVDVVGLHVMNSNDTNSGGWKSTEMASYLNSDFYNKLPADLKNVIIPTYPIVSGAGYGQTSEDITEEDITLNRLYLLSTREIGSNSQYDKKNNEITDTRTLDHYVVNSHTGASMKKDLSGQVRQWWLRSAYSRDTDTFFIVGIRGGSNTLNASSTYAGGGRVAPAFRIGTMPEFTVSFDTDGGSEVASQTITYGEKATSPLFNPVKEGYRFDNWYTTDSYDTIFDFDNTAITGDTTIYANFVSVCRDFSTASWSTIRDNLESDSDYYAVGCEKEVELDMDGDSTPESYTVRLANTSTPEVCSTEGYSRTACGTVIEFVDIAKMRAMNPTDTSVGGWKSTSMVTYLNGEFYNKLPSDLKTVIIPTYPIKSPASSSDYDRNDITEQDITKNKIYLLSPIETGSNSTNEPYITELSYTKKLDYYKINNGDSFRIKRDLSGTAQVWWLRSAQSYRNDSFYNVYTNGGYGYYLANYNWAYMGGVAPAFRIGTMPEFTVSFNTDGGSSIVSQTIEYGNKVTKPSDSTKTGYVFDNWYTDDTYQTPFDFDNTVITGNTVIYGKFDIEQFTVTFDTDGGTNIASQTVNYGEYATRPENDPTKEGLVFGGWYVDSEYITPFNFESRKIYSNITIYAQFASQFGVDSWTTIANNVRSYNTDAYHVGDTKILDLGSTGRFEVRIANMSTPVECSNGDFSRTACGFVVEFVGLVTNSIGNGFRVVSSTTDIRDGWEKSLIREYLNNTLYESFPQELKDVIADTNATSGSYKANGATYQKTTDKIYVFSSNELVKFSSVDSNTGVSGFDNSYWLTRQLDYYDSLGVTSTDNRSYLIKSDKNGRDGKYWLRSAAYTTGWEWTSITERGGVNCQPPTNYYYLSPAFRISDSYEIEFDSQGGSEASGRTIEKGFTLGNLPIVTKDEYAFDGWYTDTDYANKITKTTVPTGNTKYYAKWVYGCNNFSSDSWDTIVDNINNDPNYYPIGCEKEVSLDMNNDGEDESYTVRLSNTSAPEECSSDGFSQTACGTVIEFVDIVANRAMNYSNTNAGGWKASVVASWLNSTFYDKLPSDLRNVIIPTYPIVSGAGRDQTSLDITESDTTLNKIFLLSLKEVGTGHSGDDKRNETRKLDYYDTYYPKEYKIKKSGDTAAKWWLRTALSSYNNSFVYVDSDGYTYDYDANSSRGIAPAFRIGTN